MTVKDILEKIHNAESVQISISAEDWNLLSNNSSVVKLEGTLAEVNGEATAFIKSGNLSNSEMVAIVLFCNPEDSFSLIGAIPVEEITATGSKALYSICCEVRTAGTVEMYVIYN